MKVSEKIFMLAGLAFVVLSCETRKPQAEYSTDQDAIKMNFTISSDFTKTNPCTPEEALLFNQGDKVFVTSEDGTVEYEYGKNGWAPTDKYYFRWGSEGLEFHASYPTVSGSSYLNFPVPSNQSTLDKLAYADYMTCDIPSIHDDGSRILTFPMKRKMAKVIYTLESIDQAYPVTGFKIGSYSAYVAGYPYDECTSLTPYIEVPAGAIRGGIGTKYTVLAVPGEENPSAVQISMTYKNQPLTFYGLPAREAGMKYEYPVKIEGQVIKILDPVVTPWTDEVIPGGEAQPTKRFHYFVKPGGTGNGETWEDAMGLDRLRGMLTVSGSDVEAIKELDLAKFHFAGGDYIISETADAALSVNFKGYSSAVRISMDGGYDPSSTGTSLSSRDVVTYKTTFSGNSDRAILNLGQMVDLSFDGLFLSDAKSSGNGSAVQVTGKSKLTCNNVTFTGNKASKNGGALYITNNGEVTLNDCKASDNSAVSGGFCQIYKGKLDIEGSLSEYSSNVASSKGGCVYLNSEEACLVVGASTNGATIKFASNKASIGGAVLIETGAGTCDIQNAEFNANEGTSYGGAIAALHGTTNITDCRIINNKAASSSSSASDADITKGTGAGIAASGSNVTVSVADSYFYNNMAGKSNGNDSDCYGGAISMAGSKVSCTCCDFEGNVANRGSVLLMIKDKGGMFTAQNCAFYSNKQYSRGLCYILAKNLAYFDACSFYDNKLRGTSSAWGILVQTSSNSAVCMNNCSAKFDNNKYSSNVQAINADCHLLMTNNSFIGHAVNGVVRAVTTTSFITLVNNILINTNNSGKSLVSGDLANWYEKYNLFGVNDISPKVLDETSKDNVSGSGFSWDAGTNTRDGWYVWDGPASLSFTAPSQTEVIAAYDNFAVSVSGWGGSLSGITDVGDNFRSWLESSEPYRYTLNQRGVVRSGSYWPGSYQKNN